MSKEDRLRTSVRLRIDKGIVLLRYGGVPSMACTLLDMSQGGCRCIAPLESLDEESAAAWKRILGPHRPLSIEVSCPPHLAHFPLDAEVRGLTAAGGGGMELGLRFLNLDRRQHTLLSQAMLSFATDKVRGAFAPEKQGQASPYLVGAGSAKDGAHGPSRLQPETEQAAGAGKDLTPSGDWVPIGEDPDPAGKVQTVEDAPSGKDLPVPVPEPPEAGFPDRAGPSAYDTTDYRRPPPPPSPPQKGAAPPPPPPEPDAPASAEAALPEAAPPEASAQDPFRSKRLGEVLVRMGKLSEKKVHQALQSARITGEQLGRYLLREGWLTPAELCRALALQSGLPMTDLEGVEIDAGLALMLPYPLMKRNELLPFDESPQMVCIATANPLPPAVLAEIKQCCQREVEVFLAEEDRVLKLLDRLRPGGAHQARKHRRYRTEAPVEMQFCNRLGRVISKNVLPGRSLDISEGGFMIVAPSPNLGAPEDLRRRGLCVNLTLKVKPHDVKCLCGLRFVRVRETAKGETAQGERPWEFGLQILDISQEDRSRLKKCCIQFAMNQIPDRSTRPQA